MQVPFLGGKGQGGMGSVGEDVTTRITWGQGRWKIKVTQAGRYLGGFLDRLREQFRGASGKDDVAGMEGEEKTSDKLEPVKIGER